MSAAPRDQMGDRTEDLTDAANRLLGLTVDPLTGRIRTSDQRFDLTKARPIPDRIRILLQDKK